MVIRPSLYAQAWADVCWLVLVFLRVRTKAGVKARVRARVRVEYSLTIGEVPYRVGMRVTVRGRGESETIIETFPIVLSGSSLSSCPVDPTSRL